MWKLFNRLAHFTSSSSSRTRPAERNPSPTSTSGAFNGVRVSPSTIEVPPAPVRPQAVLSSALPEGESVPPVYSENLMRGERAGVEPRRNLPMVPPPQYTEIPLPQHTLTETATPVIHQPLTLNVPLVENEPWHQSAMHIRLAGRGDCEAFAQANLRELHQLCPEYFINYRLEDGLSSDFNESAFIAGINRLTREYSNSLQTNVGAVYVLTDVFNYIHSLPIQGEQKELLLLALQGAIRERARDNYRQDPNRTTLNPLDAFGIACAACLGSQDAWRQTLRKIARDFAYNPRFSFITPEFIENFGSLGTYSGYTPNIHETPVEPVVRVAPPVVHVAPVTVQSAPANYPRPVDIATMQQERFARNILWELYNVHPNWFGVRRVQDGVEPHYRDQAYFNGLDQLIQNFGDPSQGNAFTNGVLRDVFAHIRSLPISDRERRALIDGLRTCIRHEMTFLYNYQHPEMAPVNPCTMMIRACNNLFGSKEKWTESLLWLKRNLGSNPTFGFITTAFIENFGTGGVPPVVVAPAPVRPPRPLPVLRDAPLPVSRTPAQAQAELTDAQIARIQRGEIPTQTGWMANIPEEQRAGAIAGIVKEILAYHGEELAEYTMTDWAVETADAKHVRHLVQLLNGCTRDEVTVPRDAFFKKIAKTVRQELVRTITNSGFTPEYNDNFKFLFSLTYWNELKKEENIDRMSHLYA